MENLLLKIIHQNLRIGKMNFKSTLLIFLFFFCSSQVESQLDCIVTNLDSNALSKVQRLLNPKSFFENNHFNSTYFTTLNLAFPNFFQISSELKEHKIYRISALVKPDYVILNQDDEKYFRNSANTLNIKNGLPYEYFKFRGFNETDEKWSFTRNPIRKIKVKLSDAKHKYYFDENILIKDLRHKNFGHQKSTYIREGNSLFNYKTSGWRDKEIEEDIAVSKYLRSQYLFSQDGNLIRREQFSRGDIHSTYEYHYNENNQIHNIIEEEGNIEREINYIYKNNIPVEITKVEINDTNVILDEVITLHYNCEILDEKYIKIEQIYGEEGNGKQILYFDFKGNWIGIWRKGKIFSTEFYVKKYQ